MQEKQGNIQNRDIWRISNMRKGGKWERAEKQGNFISFALVNSRRSLKTITQFLYKKGERHCERGQSI